MNPFRVTRSLIPNLFTSMNMFAGFLSIINASQGKFIYAAWLIIIAGLFDTLDGVMARLTKSSSEIGVQLDSLADVISFGAAPGFLIFTTYLNSFDILGILVSSLLLMAGGFRLARFNVQLIGFEKSYFKGLPIPISGITIAGFVLAYYEKNTGFPEPYSSYIIPLIIVLTLLMVSRIKYDTLPKFNLQGLKTKPLQVSFVIAAVIILIITSGKALFYLFAIMILFGIFRHTYYFFVKKR
jgi:CDP-diacylglycerol---serine O-phosphatidyltransferase